MSNSSKRGNLSRDTKNKGKGRPRIHKKTGRRKGEKRRGAWAAGTKVRL